MKSLSLLFALALGLCAPTVYSQEESAQEEGELQILASIRPLALIAEDLLGDAAQVDVLIKGNASPHDYSLKMSDLRRLEAADLVLWMGPELERFLQKPLRGLPAKQVLSLADDQAGDPHQWLEPGLARRMAEAIALRLKNDFPRLADQLDRRLAEQLASYQALEEEAEKVLTPLAPRGFVVEHRGYDYFVKAFGLNQVGWISETPDQPPGVRHLLRLREQLAALPADRRARCLFVEEGHHSHDSDTLAAELGLKVQSLDILGLEADSYSELIRQLTRDMASCLGGDAVGLQ